MSRIEVSEAFHKVDRRNFLRDELVDNAEFDMPLPIGFGQTNSQPSTVQRMLEWLEVEHGNKVLDVGSGSGWTTALLGQLVGPKGRVYAVEKVPELVRFGRENAARAGTRNAQFFEADKTVGLPQYAPYDRILVSAEASELPQELVDQLKPGGKIVIPVGHTILEIAKLPNGELDIIPHPGFIFVPLVKS